MLARRSAPWRLLPALHRPVFGAASATAGGSLALDKNLYGHWVEVSAMSILLSEPHEYLRWRNHKPNYADFKKEMRVKTLSGS
jgi:hypothetical protein